MLKILTLNTWKCDGNYQKRLKAMKIQLKELSPDIIVLQECFSSDATDTAGDLSTYLNMHYEMASARYKQRKLSDQWVDSYSGLAILSTHKIHSHQCISLPVSPLDGERIAQIATFEIDGIPIAVINLHLTHLKNADELRYQQLETIMNHLLQDKISKCFFLCGDFNTISSTPPLKLLEDRYHARHSFYLKDPQSPLPPTIHNRCIDYIYVTTFNIHELPQCINSQKVLDTQQDGVFPSDHAGILATFIF